MAETQTGSGFALPACVLAVARSWGYGFLWPRRSGVRIPSATPDRRRKHCLVPAGRLHVSGRAADVLEPAAHLRGG